MQKKIFRRIKNIKLALDLSNFFELYKIIAIAPAGMSPKLCSLQRKAAYACLPLFLLDFSDV